MGARRIVFDALDMVLACCPILRPHGARSTGCTIGCSTGLTGLITAKAASDQVAAQTPSSWSFCSSWWTARCPRPRRRRRRLAAQPARAKYRGALRRERVPFVIGKSGVEVARRAAPIPRGRDQRAGVGGVKRLDTMLGGGYYRGASVLITGFPGTAKTTLSGRLRRGGLPAR